MPSTRALSLVDVFLFLADARLPWTCRELAEPFLKKKRRVYILTKPDLADPGLTDEWIRALRDLGEPAYAVNCHTGKGIRPLLDHLGSEKRRIDAKRPQGQFSRPLRTMLFGTPNVGKSSLANRLLGSRKAPFGSRPGLTRSSTWLKGERNSFLMVLDTPGVLDVSRVKGEVKNKLACVWALRETAYDAQEAAVWLASVLSPEREPTAFIEAFASSRGIRGPGGTLDTHRACVTLLQAFREGQTGKVTLEKPWDFPKFGGFPDSATRVQGDDSTEQSGG